MKLYLFAAAASLGAFAAPALAQAPAPAAPPLKGNWLQADQTRQQAQQRAAMLFQRLDANRDGTITREEAQQASTGKGGKRAGRMLERLFSQSASVTQAQFQSLALARFDRQDMDHNGVVTADERQQARAARKQRAQ